MIQGHVDFTLKGNHSGNILILILTFSGSYRCATNGKKISVPDVKYFWRYKQLKLHSVKYFLFRAWLVVMSLVEHLAETHRQ